MKVGILGLQGDVRRHSQALQQLAVTTLVVRHPAELERADCLIIPGGESTTMSKMLEANNLLAPLAERVQAGLPTWGTCAGMILLARELLDGRDDQLTLGATDLAVRRNGYGRQVDSFEAPLEIAELGGEPFCGVFIRAPVVEQVLSSEVEVLASLEDTPVLCRQGHVWACSFHPELTDDLRLHELFIKEAA